MFCFKNGQNRRFNLWKHAVSGCIWRCCDLSVFMHFCEGMDGFPSVYTAFCRSGLLTCILFFLGPSLGLFGTFFGERPIDLFRQIRTDNSQKILWNWEHQKTRKNWKFSKKNFFSIFYFCPYSLYSLYIARGLTKIPGCWKSMRKKRDFCK